MTSVVAPPTGDTTTEPTTEQDTNATANVISETFPPSHILQDGRFIYLPPPTSLERSRYFERSIARYGLLETDMEQLMGSDKKDDTNEPPEKKKKNPPS